MLVAAHCIHARYYSSTATHSLVTCLSEPSVSDSHRRTLHRMQKRCQLLAVGTRQFVLNSCIRIYRIARNSQPAFLAVESLNISNVRIPMYCIALLPSYESRCKIDASLMPSVNKKFPLFECYNCRRLMSPRLFLFHVTVCKRYVILSR